MRGMFKANYGGLGYGIKILIMRVLKCGDFWITPLPYGWKVYNEVYEVRQRYEKGKVIIRLKAK